MGYEIFMIINIHLYNWDAISLYIDSLDSGISYDFFPHLKHYWMDGLLPGRLLYTINFVNYISKQVMISAV